MANILIVDDDIDLLDGQRMFLESKGYTVHTAKSMTEGLAALDAFAPDLILADLMMEHYDSGFVFCKKAKEKSGMANVPILMQTAASREVGFTFDTASPEARKWIKVEEVLTKPVPLENLAGKIAQYLKR